MIKEGVFVNKKYKIIRQLGEGGMAQVWLAEETSFGNLRVALKVPRPSLTEEETQILQERIEREVRICADLTKTETPNVVNALTAEHYQAGICLVMEYMPGGDLAKLISESPGGMPLDQVKRITIDILTAIEAIHNHPLAIRHRDIKPSNILFNAKGKACLGDFGLAMTSMTSGVLTRIFGKGYVAGTPAYMAPEQAQTGGYLTPAADLYSFGCVMWEMVTGKKYRDRRPGTPPSKLRSDCPDDLDNIIMKALQEDPFERWNSAVEMREDITRGSKKTNLVNTVRLKPQNISDPKLEALFYEAAKIIKTDRPKAKRILEEMRLLNPTHGNVSKLETLIENEERDEQRKIELKEKIDGLYALAMSQAIDDPSLARRTMKKIILQAPSYEISTLEDRILARERQINEQKRIEELNRLERNRQKNEERRDKSSRFWNNFFSRLLNIIESILRFLWEAVIYNFRAGILAGLIGGVLFWLSYKHYGLNVFTIIIGENPSPFAFILVGLAIGIVIDLIQRANKNA